MENKEIKNYLGLILIMISGTGIMSFNAGIFVLYAEKALHIKRSAFFLVNSLTIASSAITLPLFKKLSNKFKPCAVSSFCGIASSFIYLLFSLSNNLFSFLILGFLLGIFINGLSSPFATPLINSLFKDKKEFFLGLSLALVTMSGAFSIKLLDFIIRAFSLRWGYLFISLLGFILSLSGSFLIKDLRIFERQYFNLLTSFAFPLKNKGTGLLCFLLFYFNLVNLALYNNLYPYLNSINFSFFSPSDINSVTLVLMIFSRPLWGYVFSKAGSKKSLFLLSFAPFLTSFFYLLTKNNDKFIIPAAVFLSFSSAFNTIPASSFSKNYKNKGSEAFTSFMFFSFMGSSLGSGFSSIFFDIFKSYTPAWILILCISPLFSFLSLKLKNS